MENKFDNELEKMNIRLTDDQKSQFDLYYELLIEWNQFMNLTGITDYDEVNLKHFTDSLTISRIIDMAQINTLIDVGTGAGFPGIPIKIAFPHIKVYLLDSLNKRIKFLNEVIKKLGLKNIYAFHGRAEDFAKDRQYREKFDVCVSRAVANLSTLSEYCIPFVRVNGFFVSYKAGKGLEEIESSDSCMRALGSKIMQVDEFQLPGEDSLRVLIKIKKCKGTPKAYPRKAGVPSKNPL